jgi:hypothetical protein
MRVQHRHRCIISLPKFQMESAYESVGPLGLPIVPGRGHHMEAMREQDTKQSGWSRD